VFRYASDTSRSRDARVLHSKKISTRVASIAWIPAGLLERLLLQFASPTGWLGLALGFEGPLTERCEPCGELPGAIPTEGSEAIATHDQL